MSGEKKNDKLGFDAFDELGDISVPEIEPIEIAETDAPSMQQVREETGYARPLTAKEELKPLQFRLPKSERQAFHDLALEEYGNTHGAKTALFRKMWKFYEDNKPS